MKILPLKSAKITPDDDLVEIFFRSLKKAKYILRDGDIVAIVSKIVSLTEGRLVALDAELMRERGIPDCGMQSGAAYKNQLQKSARADFSASKLAQRKSTPGARTQRSEVRFLSQKIEMQNFSQREKTTANIHGGRYGKYAPDPTLTALIRKEADKLYEDEMFLTIKDGIFIPSAGIDTSNVPEGYAILWPRDAYKSAEKIRAKILEKINQDRGEKKLQSKKNNHEQLINNIEKQKIKNLGILIFDSHILPLRRGVTGIALGYAGFEGVEDCRGRRDLEGKALCVTFRNIADNLASAATLLTGEADEKTPFVIIRDAIDGTHGFGGRNISDAGESADDSTHLSQHSSRISQSRIQFTDKKIRRSEIQISPDECLFRSLYHRTFVVGH